MMREVSHVWSVREQPSTDHYDLWKVVPRQVFLAHQIEKSYILPHVRNSYPTLVISPRSHRAFKCSS